MGQNLCGPFNGDLQLSIKWDPSEIKRVVEMWYKEGDKFTYEQPALKSGRFRFENFAQMMWFGTTSVGFAISRDGRYAVANYFPAGLQVAYVAENVHAPCQGTVPWEAQDPLPLPPAPDYSYLLYEGGVPEDVAEDEVPLAAELAEQADDTQPSQKKEKNTAAVPKKAGAVGAATAVGASTKKGGASKAEKGADSQKSSKSPKPGSPKSPKRADSPKGKG